MLEQQCRPDGIDHDLLCHCFGCDRLDRLFGGMAVDHQGAGGVDDQVELSMRRLQPQSAFQQSMSHP